MITLGIGDYGVTVKKGEILKTFGLGSCVAVCCADLKVGLAAMIHIALPDSAINLERTREKPGYFADSGLDALFLQMAKLGFIPRPGQFRIKLVGGANILDSQNTFNIGKRNVLAIKRLLWAKGFGPVAEDIGGTYSRTVSLEAGTDKVLVSSPGKENWVV